MKDIPVIFSGPMIRALLEDRKTMTRRLAHAWLQWVDGSARRRTFTAATYAQAISGRQGMRAFEPGPGEVAWRWTSAPIHEDGGEPMWLVFPKIQPGDRLWVKETHWRFGKWKQSDDGRWHFEPIPAGQAGGLMYDQPDSIAQARTDLGWHKRPSIYMPRWASRLTLTISALKLEPLQDISEADAILEGATSKPALCGYRGLDAGWSMDWQTPYRDHALTTAQTAFGSFINELHGGKGWNLKPSNLWVENPEMLAMTFTKRDGNIDKLAGAQ